jgi:long-subunit acyl-CoA synthetase (AMP-forming)
MEAATTGQATRAGLALDAGTLTEAFQRTAGAHADAVALRTPGGEMQITWAQYGERVRDLAAGLAAHGVGTGDTVAIMLTNRPETVLVDSAAMHIGAIPFSIYNTSSPEQVEYLFSHARCSVVVTETQFASTVLDVAGRVDSIEHVFLVDGEMSGARTLGDLESAGARDFDFEAAWRAVRPTDIATLIYTSGTTGPPKAVELTHENLLWEIRLLDRVFPMRAGGRTISYLPMAHLADRCAAHYQAIVSGATVTFVGDVSQVIGALIDVRPTSWGAVPRVWEKLKAALEAGFASEADPERRRALAAALALSTRLVRAQQAGEEVQAELLRERERADVEYFAPLRAMLGLDEVDYLISGAAPIAAEVLEFFSALGLPICEIWGMTETSLIATSNPQDAIRIGTVGPALPGIELSLAQDGELLVRGPTIMRGYRGDPELTAQTIGPGGWLHTGDIAEIDADGYVRIVDRKKELIINAAGKNMSPANIENRIKAACPLVGSVVAIGDRRPYNTALVVLDPVAATAYAAAHGLSASSPAELAEDEEIRAEVQAGIERANQALSRVEQIKRHTILPEEWQPGGDELTPTMKLRRRPIAEKYGPEIQAMYES